jgi:signal transduction histidine kinase
MKSVPLRFPKLSDSLVMRYVLATLGTIAAVLVRRALDPWLGTSVAFVTIFPAIAFSAVFLGTGPAVLSILLGLVGVNYFILPPNNAFSLTPPAYAGSLTYVVIAALFVVAIADASRRSYRRRQQAEVALHASEAQLGAKVANDAVLEERNRLSREIHDTCAQSFTAVILQLEAAEETLSQNPAEVRGYLISARELARASLRELRAVVWNLRSDSLANIDLPMAIENFVQKTFSGIQMEVSVSTQGIVRELPKQIEIGLLRISQEAATNVIKHANASNVRVELSYEPSHVQLSVQDNGRSFNYASRPTHGLGLTSMRERAKGMGGELSIYSAPGQGTRIEVLVPVPVQVAQESKYEAV